MENIDNLSNAHAVAVRHGLYQPLSQEQIRASVAGPEPLHRPAPPPMIRGGNPDMSPPVDDLHTCRSISFASASLTHSGQNSRAEDNWRGQSENYTLPAKNFRTLVYWAHGGVCSWQGKHIADRKRENWLWIGRVNSDCFPRRLYRPIRGDTAPHRSRTYVAKHRSNGQTRE